MQSKISHWNTPVSEQTSHTLNVLEFFKNFHPRNMNFFQNDVSHHIHVMKSLFVVKKCVALQVARNFSYVARKKKSSCPKKQY